MFNMRKSTCWARLVIDYVLDYVYVKMAYSKASQIQNLNINTN